MQHRTKIIWHQQRGGFTLVEMLVSVALILLMMTMFSSVFQLATESISTHRAIGERDQKVRQLATIIKADFAKRTQRYPLAFYQSEDLDRGPKSPDSRDGYFYLNTNDPDSHGDDIVQFTVRSTNTAENPDTTEYYGAAAPLIDREAGSTTANLYQNPNQPEVDDGSLSADFASSSPAAEIAYFIRNGNLYRRVILIRNPRRIAGGELQAQPTSRLGNNFFSGEDDMGNYNGAFRISNIGLTNDFHTHFDFAALNNIDLSGNSTAKFLSVESLSNKLSSSGAANEAFGNPIYRFGFHNPTGLSREHDNLSTRQFIGRFLHAETSTTNFNWPQISCVAEGSDDSDPTSLTLLGNGNPYDIGGTSLTYNPGEDLVTQFDSGTQRGGIRKMEDLLLANVHGFSVELWDERTGRFVVPGYGSGTDPAAAVGDYHIRRNLQYQSSVFTYGPLAPYDPTATVDADKQPHVFDTWHPAPGPVGVGGLSIDTNGDGTADGLENAAPYIGYVVYPPRTTDTPPGPSSTNMPDPATSVPSGLNYRGYWEESPGGGTPVSYAVGDIVFARTSLTNPGWDEDGDGVFEWDPTQLGVAAEDSVPPQAFQIAYRCIVAGDSGDSVPNWPQTPGKRMSEQVTNGTAVWESFDNRRPLKAVRLTIRFMNSATGKPRQLKLVLSMTSGI